MTAQDLCPCGSTLTYQECCKPFHLGTPAITAEQLMRSRYSAYCLQLVDYLVQTTHPDQRTKGMAEDIAHYATITQFTSLTIVQTRLGQEKDKQGKVEFIATYQQDRRQDKQHELSRFRRYKGRWHYVDGVNYDD